MNRDLAVVIENHSEKLFLLLGGQRPVVSIQFGVLQVLENLSGLEGDLLGGRGSRGVHLVRSLSCARLVRS